MKRYKVISQKDKWFSGKFDPVVLVRVLNEHAEQGWRVVSIVSASREGVLSGGGKDELVIVLEADAVAKRALPAVSAEPRLDGSYQL